MLSSKQFTRNTISLKQRISVLFSLHIFNAQPGIVRSTFVFEWNRVDLDADDKEFSSSCWGIINGEAFINEIDLLGTISAFRFILNTIFDIEASS